MDGAGEGSEGLDFFKASTFDGASWELESYILKIQTQINVSPIHGSQGHVLFV